VEFWGQGAMGSGADPKRSQRVLVIEDEAKMASLVSRALVAAGFGVDTEPTGLRALELLRARLFDLVILDLLLPDIDGVSVLTNVGELDPEPPVIVLSALGDVRSKVMCLELGACDYMTKPFELAELIARVRLRSRERQPARDRYMRRGHYVLDLQQRAVEDGDGPIALTTREFVLLEYLMSHAGQTCSREELLEHVWGYAFDPGTNVVDVCIGRLRHKLGGGCVATVRNVGYCFVGA
jgi:two-component system OmpR family response regulator